MSGPTSRFRGSYTPTTSTIPVPVSRRAVSLERVRASFRKRRAITTTKAGEL
jgi:hypothetical protein